VGLDQLSFGRSRPSLAAPPRLVAERRDAAESAAALDTRAQRQPSAARGAWHWLGANARLTIGLGVVLAVVVVALLAPVIAPHPPDAQLYEMRLAPPNSTYWFGGDAVGRDVFSRLVYAARVSLAVALPSMLIAVVIGVAVGSIAGYYRGWADRLLMRFTDVVLVFPTFFLLILAVSVFGRSLSLLVLMIGLTAWPTNARVVRALVLSLRDRDFITASRLSGGNDHWVIGRHLIPQLTPIIVSSATIRVANNILVESGLSFLGLGVAPPTPTWGNMVADGADAMRQAWWLVAIPGLTIFVVVLAFNLMGEGIRDLLDPRRKRR
jgi:peptide/nickel transport system permease protein